ncbi:hypothetical protein E6H37_02125 [Candidatus Bathyarchaeota archaeon]|nr:MAG: hypothetical protein E6H37_02125 [Candidatus Bathyarchaeota archaeon]
MKKRYKILAFVILLTVITISAVAAYVYSEYVPRVLVDDSLTLKENHQWQFDLFVFGTRNVNITVSTVRYLVFVTFWYQQNQAATTYLFDKPVTNVTQAGFNVSVPQSGTYYLSVQKTEQYGENVTTTVHVEVIS